MTGVSGWTGEALLKHSVCVGHKQCCVRACGLSVGWRQSERESGDQKGQEKSWWGSWVHESLEKDGHLSKRDSNVGRKMRHSVWAILEFGGKEDVPGLFQRSESLGPIGQQEGEVSALVWGIGEVLGVMKKPG